MLDKLRGFLTNDDDAVVLDVGSFQGDETVPGIAVAVGEGALQLLV